MTETKEKAIPTQPCAACRGTGATIDHGLLGAILRAEREERSISLREMARRLGIEAPYLSDLERGNRHWSPERAEQYRKLLHEP